MELFWLIPAVVVILVVSLAWQQADFWRRF